MANEKDASKGGEQVTLCHEPVDAGRRDSDCAQLPKRDPATLRSGDGGDALLACARD
jgi:hypothetical protein